VFQSIVGQWFLSVLEPSLDNCQFGCRKRRSTVHAPRKAFDPEP